ncbi:MAG: hypothetical protein NC911_03465 [Candidatus Omnitrophica bacterium]|nr:hypothetical protein [Candidatus Omnitrophota bacterium]
MAYLNEEEKKRIIEEEELRSQVRRRYEQKSSGLAAVLSTICPGLGQIYNGQFGKGTAFFLIVLTGLFLLCWGIVVLVKSPGGSAVKIAGAPVISRSEPVEMNEEGIVQDEMQKEEQPTERKQESSKRKLPVKGLLLTVAGLILMGEGAHQAVRDAIRTAQRLNQGYSPSRKGGQS